MMILNYLLYIVVIIGVLFLIKTIVKRVMKNMMDDYGSMLSNSEKSDAEERKKNTYIFFPKH